MKYFFLSLLLLTCFNETFCQAGSLDKSFSNDGKLSTLVGITSSDGNAVAIQSNGKIVVAGDYYNGNHNNKDFAVVRYNTDGTLDNSFAGNGKAGIDFGADDVASGVAIQSDGKIVVVGNSAVTGGSYFAATRLNTDGTVDASFGAAGKIKAIYKVTISAVAIQQDDKIVVAGSYIYNTSNETEFIVIRLNADGSFDSSFDTNGEVLTKFYNVDDEATAVAIQSDGKILASGSSDRNGTNVFAIARYNTNGMLDVSFGGDGRVTTSVGNSSAWGTSMAVQPDKKILQAGYFFNSAGNHDFAIIRYLSNGELDNSFAGNGKAAVSFGNNNNDVATSIAIQSDKKIILAGADLNINTIKADFALARLNSNGTLDNSFGGTGKVLTGFSENAAVYALAIQSNGKIVAAGGGDLASTKIYVARYLASSSSSINQENIAGIKNSLPEIKIYPDPVSDVLHIDGLNASPAIITITDLSGNILLKKPFQSTSESLNVSMLKQGIYNLNIIQDDATCSQKFLKQ